MTTNTLNTKRLPSAVMGTIENYQRNELRRIREWNRFVLSERKRLAKK